MAIRPLIGITSSSARPGTGEAHHDRLNHAYSRSVWAAGGVPVVVANIEGEDHARELLTRLDGLLLSGGDDVDPSAYGEEPLNDTVSPDALRDASEFPLIRAAVHGRMPILAICRGIQSLNVALGGTLYQDLPAQRPSRIAHRQSAARHVATHDLTVERDSLLARVAGTDPFPVNSFHHQAVRDIAEGYRVVARAEDGIVEAIEDPEQRFALAVQFHPEEMFEVSARSRQLFEAFVAACAER